MNSLNINHIKVEKANAIKLRYQKLQKVTSFFRAFEILLILTVVSKLSFQVPLALGVAFRLSCEYLRYLSLLLVSPQFVFILGNAIVITLFLNSGHFNTSPQVKLPKSPPHEHKITKSLPKKQGMPEANTLMATIFATPSEVKLPKSPPHERKITCTKPLPMKQGITEENAMMKAICTTSPPAHHRQVAKVYHRSKSEKPPRREKSETGCSSLRRSNTEVIKSLRVKIECCEEAGEGHYPEDHMSSEEFRKTIEDFIAKQQRSLREEEEFSALESNFDL